MSMYTVTLVFTHHFQKVLLAPKRLENGRRHHNGIEGKRQGEETMEEAAYRSLTEKTSLSREKIAPLALLMTQQFPNEDVLSIFFTHLQEDVREEHVALRGLLWRDVNAMVNVNDSSLSGYGSLPYWVHYAHRHQPT